ncbi:MAG: cyclodeaminase [Deltaproteobacteria bacterium]
MIRVATETMIRNCVEPDLDVMAEIEAGFTALAEGRVTQPPILRVDVPDHHGELDVKSAYVRGLDSFAVKMSTGFFDNPQRGLPSGGGLMVLLSSETGAPIAVLLDNGYLTDVRTALAGAIAAKHLAREQVTTVGIIGAGNQARLQLAALRLVRDFSHVLVFARDAAKASAYANEVRERYDVAAEPASLESVCAESDVLVTTTPAKAPLVRAEWLRPGVHVTAMGSDAEDKQELEADVLRRADRVVVDVIAQSRRLGELRNVQDVDATELGQLTKGAVPGRMRPDDITVCDLTGTGVQDTMIARMAHRRLVERGWGTDIDT